MSRSAAPPSQTFSAIGACAGAMGLENHPVDGGMGVYRRDLGVIRYVLADDGVTVLMAVTVDDSKVPAADVEPTFRELKRQGDEIYACAQSYPGEVAMAPPPRPATPPEPEVLEDSSCTRMVACYQELSATLCAPDDGDCAAQFEVSVSGDDEEGCVAALAQAHVVVDPFRGIQADLTMPASCLVDSAEPGVAVVGAAHVALPAAPAQTAQPTAPSQPVDIDWRGNWSVAVTYEWECAVPFSESEQGDDQGRWTLNVSGPDRELSAEVTGKGGYYLSGSASSAGLRLCGGFPLSGKGGPTAVENDVCLIIDSIHGHDQASGSIEGKYRTGTGFRCSVVDGIVEMTR
ncbi:hypothetical protein [Haliangium sp.]|uniref:hypothetical protein n=2 Tax=Haliangium sp. TaxID=2663208 RepID=UPI003D146EFE